MKFNKTLFIFFTILVIVSFVVALPTDDDFDKLKKKRDLDSELKDLISKHSELKGYVVDQLNDIVHSNGLDTIEPDDLLKELLFRLLVIAMKKLGEILTGICRSNFCNVPFCIPIVCA